MRPRRTAGSAEGRTGPRVSWLAPLLTVLLLSSCQPLYIPPVPTPLELPEQYEVDATAALDAGRPRLSIDLINVIEPAWLAVQWFSPANREVASESVWVTPSDEGSTARLRLPQDVMATSGRWRVVLSVDDLVLRQLSVEVP